MTEPVIIGRVGLGDGFAPRCDLFEAQPYRASCKHHVAIAGVRA